jgi:hypothetical protein
MIFLIGLSAIILVIQAIRYSSRGDIIKLKKYIVTNIPKAPMVLGIIAIIIWLLF